MRANFTLSRQAARRRLLTTVVTCILLIVAAQTAAAQCVPNPTGETAVGLRNASSYYLLFFIDGIRMDGVPAGERSIDFPVTPGDHTLRADANVGGETVSAYRMGVIPEGEVCTWTVTDPSGNAGAGQKGFRDSLRVAPKRDSVRPGGRRP